MSFWINGARTDTTLNLLVVFIQASSADVKLNHGTTMYLYNTHALMS